LVKEKVIHSPYVKGVLEFIQSYHRKFVYFISTGTPEDKMIDILKSKDIFKCFKNVYGSPTVKTVHINTILSEFNYSPSNVVFIGDSPSDKNAPKDCGINFIGRTVVGHSMGELEYTMCDLTSLQKIIRNL